MKKALPLGKALDRKNSSCRPIEPAGVISPGAPGRFRGTPSPCFLRRSSVTCTEKSSSKHVARLTGHLWRMIN